MNPIYDYMPVPKWGAALSVSALLISGTGAQAAAKSQHVQQRWSNIETYQDQDMEPALNPPAPFEEILTRGSQLSLEDQDELDALAASVIAEIDSSPPEDHDSWSLRIAHQLSQFED